MLAKRGTEDLINNPDWWLERKFDGTRVITVIKNNTPRMFGRSGNEYTDRYSEIIDELKQLPDGTYDGELSFYENGKERFITALAREETKENLEYYYQLFDIIETTQLFNQRRIKLESLFSKLKNTTYLKLSYIARTLEDKKRLSKHLKKIGAEGAMIKYKNAYYEFGRSKFNLKLKNEHTEDLVVKAWKEGTGRREDYFGALVGYQLVNDNWEKVANVGGGFKDEDLEYIQNKFLGKNGTVKKEFVIEIRYLNKTNKFNYRMPQFVRIRTDKPVNDCVWR